MQWRATTSILVQTTTSVRTGADSIPSVGTLRDLGSEQAEQEVLGKQRRLERAGRELHEHALAYSCSRDSP